MRSICFKTNLKAILSGQSHNSKGQDTLCSITCSIESSLKNTALIFVASTIINNNNNYEKNVDS